MVILSTLSVVAIVAICVGLIWPLTVSCATFRKRLGWTLGVGAVLLLFSQYRRALHLGGLQMIISPDAIPTIFVIFCLWVEITLVVAMLLAGVRIVLAWCKLRPHPVPFIALAALCGAAMLILGKVQPRFEEVMLPLADLPAEAEGLRVAVVADLHLDQWNGAAWCTTFVERLNAQKPDLILFTGDQTDGTVTSRIKSILPLAQLQAPAYCVSGNHEWYFDGEAMMRAYDAVRLQTLDNKVVSFKGLTLIGLPDAATLINDDNAARLPLLIKDIPSEACTILLSHKPAIATLADELGIDLQLSGHTHGGQIPGMDKLIARYNKGFVRGFYTLKHLILFVSPGASTWIGFPFRIYPPIVTFLTLTAQGK